MRHFYVIKDGIEIEQPWFTREDFDCYSKRWEAFINKYICYDDEGNPISEDAYKKQLHKTQNEDYLIEELNK